MKKAIQFGAGNIGRGFIGAVLEQAGYHVVYTDINKAIVNEINEKKTYPVHIMDTKCYDQEINNISAVYSLDEELLSEMETVTIITTAVGLNILPDVASTLAEGLKNRMDKGIVSSLNIIACENGIRATSYLKQEIFKCLTPSERKYIEKHVGFPDCSVDRIVPPLKIGNSIDVVVEYFYEWNVEQKSIVGTLPVISGMTLVDDLMVSIERKLFSLNTGHAITAYLGLLKQYKTVDQSIADKEIYGIVKSAMEESGMALVKKYNLDKEEHFLYIDKILDRFNNPYLMDDLDRVGREPIRKLSKDDRLIRPMLIANSYGLAIDHLVIGIAAALCYDNKNDIQSVQMQKSIVQKGVKETLSEIIGFKIQESILDRIEEEYINLKTKAI